MSQKKKSNNKNLSDWWVSFSRQRFPDLIAYFTDKETYMLTHVPTPMDFQDFQDGCDFFSGDLNSSYSSVFRPGLQPSKEGQRSLCVCTGQEEGRAEATCHPRRVFNIIPTLRVSAAEGLKAFRHLAVYISTSLKSRKIRCMINPQGWKWVMPLSAENMAVTSVHYFHCLIWGWARQEVDEWVSQHSMQ